MSDIILVLAIGGFIVGWLIAQMVSDYHWGKLYYELNKANYISNIQAPTTAELNAGHLVPKDDDTPGQAAD